MSRVVIMPMSLERKVPSSLADMLAHDRFFHVMKLQISACMLSQIRKTCPHDEMIVADERKLIIVRLNIIESHQLQRVVHAA